MNSTSSDPASPPKSPSPQRPEQAVTMLVIGLILLYVLWTLRTPTVRQGSPEIASASGAKSLPSEMIPLVTGDEPVSEIFVRAGCPVCHTIPGIPGATGQVGPPLLPGSTGARRLADPSYRGQAKTVRDYIVESVLDPGVFVVPGYPERTMPDWYGAKLSALAVEKIAGYLEGQGEAAAAQ